MYKYITEGVETENACRAELKNDSPTLLGL